MNERMRAVAGHTGFGKTSLLRKLIASRDRVLILEQSSVKSEYPWAWRFNSVDELYRDMQEHRPRRFCVSVCPGRSRFVDCLRLAWALAPILVVIEEMGKYFPMTDRERAPHHLPLVGGIPGEFMEICERGRHAGPDALQPVEVIGVFQRPMRGPLCFRAELERIYSFRLNSKHDRRWLAECPGADDAIAEETKNLPKFHYLNIDANGGVTRETTTP